MMSEADDRLERLRGQGWIGVDLDGTLAYYDKWVKWNVIGDPIPLMQARVRRWLEAGHDVRIMTARAHFRYTLVPEVCLITGESFTHDDMVGAVQDWTERHVGRRLPVTCCKDVHMIELWDDRAVQVESNTGRTLAETYEAEMSALRGKP